ncbi:MAG: hypothetical protein ACREMK_06195 [Gemmatimonadota bacterium]
MNLYSIALFLHVMGALGMFIALGIEWTSLRNLPRATTAQEARGWLGPFLLLRRIYPPSFLAILVTGIYMMAVSWGGAPWIVIGLFGLLALPALAVVTGRRMRRLGPAIGAARGELDDSLRASVTDPALWLSLRLRMGLAVGIIFLMTVKPGWIGSLVAIALFTGIGAFVSLVARKRPQTGPATAPREAT